MKKKFQSGTPQPLLPLWYLNYTLLSQNGTREKAQHQNSSCITKLFCFKLCNNSSFGGKMIDTVKIMLTDYEITEDAEITVQPSCFILSTGAMVEHALFNVKNKGTVYGSKAYANSENWNLTLKPVLGMGTGAFLQLSVPKNHYGSNYYSVGEGGTKAVLNKVENELNDRGIKTNLQEAELSRLDTFKNIEPEEHFSSYYSLFQTLNAKRTTKRDYGTTFLYSNTQQEFCVYDKKEEMRNRKLDTEGLPETMRFEHRLLNKTKINSVYGFTGVKDIFKGGYEVIRDKQIESWRNNLFKYEADEVLVLGSRQIEEEMRAYRERHGRNWLQYYLKSYGSYYLTQNAGKEAVGIALMNIEEDRVKAWRASKILEEAERELINMKMVEGTNKTMADLYDELKIKVCEN